MEEQRRKRVSVEDPLAPVRISPVRVNGHQVTQQGVEILNDNGDWEAIPITKSSAMCTTNASQNVTASGVLSQMRL